jgi:hypothetical protein
MPTMADAARIALELPGVVEGVRHGHRCWSVGEKVFAWERPFSKADLKRFGSTTPPSGEILAVSVLDLEDKEALLAVGLAGVFTIPHFDGYPAVLVELAGTSIAVLDELIADAWFVRAPRALAEHLRRSSVDP